MAQAAHQAFVLDCVGGGKCITAMLEATSDAREVRGTSWASCPHAVANVRSRLCAIISSMEHFEMKNVSAEFLEPGCSDGGSVLGAALEMTIVSLVFQGKRPLDRQRMVFVALQDELQSGAIHSLPRLQTLDPDQWRARTARTPSSWVKERLVSSIGTVHHLEVVDVTNGHAIEGFFDGSGRALDPHGLELQILVVSEVFDGKPLLQRQQLVSDALGPELMSGAIHALPRMKTWTPAEWEKKRGRGEADAKRQRRDGGAAEPREVRGKL
uniref:Uncharacterized protein n=1 Tax=Noctiluca scintillans TaxID=2966 RepID=A0A7S1AEU7_NOCSC